MHQVGALYLSGKRGNQIRSIFSMYSRIHLTLIMYEEHTYDSYLLENNVDFFSRGKSSISIQEHAVLSSNIAEVEGDNCTGYSLDGGAIVSHGDSAVAVVDWSSIVGNR